MALLIVPLLMICLQIMAVGNKMIKDSMKRYFAILCVVALMVGCAKDNEVCQPQSVEPYSISIDLQDEVARTSLGEEENGLRKIYWSNGDCIAVNGVASLPLQLEEEQATYAKFLFNSVLEYPCEILYPASFYKDAATITLPKEQQVVEGTFATNASPMASIVATNEETPHMHHLAGVLHLQLMGNEKTRNNFICKIELTGNNGEQLYGDFTIDYEKAQLTPTSTKSKTIVVRLAEELSLTEITNIYIVVPAQEFENGFSVRLINDEGHFMDKVKRSAATIRKGGVLTMPVIEYVPTGTIIGVEI